MYNALEKSVTARLPNKEKTSFTLLCHAAKYRGQRKASDNSCFFNGNARQLVQVLYILFDRRFTMKKVILVLLVAIVFIPSTFANGQGETQTSINGTAVVTENANGTKSLAIQTRDGDLVQVVIGEADMSRLQIRNNEQIQVSGVFLGRTTENQVQERIFARTMTIDGKTTTMQEPIQLTKQEWEQLRAYESIQTQTQTRSSTRTGTSSGEGSGSGTTGGGSGGSSKTEK